MRLGAPARRCRIDGPGLATTAFRPLTGRPVMTKTVLAKIALGGEVGFTVAPVYLAPHVAGYPSGRVYRAVPSDKDRQVAVRRPMAARDQARFRIIARKSDGRASRAVSTRCHLAGCPKNYTHCPRRSAA
jgi:hypothetical protein